MGSPVPASEDPSDSGLAPPDEAVCLSDVVIGIWRGREQQAPYPGECHQVVEHLGFRCRRHEVPGKTLLHGERLCSEVEGRFVSATAVMNQAEMVEALGNIGMVGFLMEPPEHGFGRVQLLN